MTPESEARKPESFSSQQTEKYAIQKRSIELVRTIVGALGLERSNDTLLRWIAHYIAELVAKTDYRSGAKQEKN